MVLIPGLLSNVVQKSTNKNNHSITEKDINKWLNFQVDKELQKAEDEERKLRMELEKAKKKETERKRQVS